MHRLRLTIALLSFALPLSVSAMPSVLTYTYQHHIFTINVTQHPEWKKPQRIWFYHGVRAEPPARLKTCGTTPIDDEGWTYEERNDWNESAIMHTVESDIASKLNRASGTVTIAESGSGTIVFEGRGLTGRTVNSERTAVLTHTAIENDIDTIALPVEETQPQITVKSPRLRGLGIKEVVTIGESVFSRSPVNRRHNISVGIAKLNGHLIQKDEIFSFVSVLGPVNEKTGYKKELVIQGDETLPDYGGGLCQVSSTAYRGPWEYGMPIIQRKNHSYAVSYYSPQGTDATIYPPNVDMKFKNDTKGALLIQSFIDNSDHAYFIYYGTKDARKSEVFGPFISDRVSAPKIEKISYTTEIPPGEKRKASERHDGMKAVWYRTVQREGETPITERYFSAYQTRPLYWQIGVTPEEMARLTKGATNEEPSWLPTNP